MATSTPTQSLACSFRCCAEYRNSEPSPVNFECCVRVNCATAQTFASMQPHYPPPHQVFENPQHEGRPLLNQMPEQPEGSEGVNLDETVTQKKLQVVIGEAEFDQNIGLFEQEESKQ